MLKLTDIDLTKQPDLIQPPKGLKDNIVVIELVPDTKDIIKTDIIDVALSYAVAGIHVILEIPFSKRKQFDTKQLASFVCNGGWSLSISAPKSYQKKYEQAYYEYIVTWYKLWRSETMSNFEKVIYPITPYIEYLVTNYLVEHYKIKAKQKKQIIHASQNPTDPCILDFIDNIKHFIGFKEVLEKFIKKHDNNFYKDIDALTAKTNAIVVSI